MCKKVSFKSNRIPFLLKCTWDILQDGSRLGHKSSLSKFKKTEIISSIFSDHDAMRLDINYRGKKTAKKPKLMEIKQSITK